jgi:hypothetical protein
MIGDSKVRVATPLPQETTMPLTWLARRYLMESETDSRTDFY